MYRYAYKVEDESIVARGLGKALPISWKQGVEISNFIRGKPLEKATAFLENVIAMKVPVPFKRFNGDVGHRKGNMASGRYPQKASKQILSVLNSAESNAKDKGLIVESLYIAHICIHKAAKQMHYGRKGNREMKKANVEVILKENVDLKKKIEKTKKTPSKEATKKDKETQLKKEAPIKEDNKDKTNKEIQSTEANKQENKNTKTEDKTKEVPIKETKSEKSDKKEEEKKELTHKESEKIQKEVHVQSPKKVKSNSKTQEKVEE